MEGQAAPDPAEVLDGMRPRDLVYIDGFVAVEDRKGGRLLGLFGEVDEIGPRGRAEIELCDRQAS